VQSYRLYSLLAGSDRIQSAQMISCDNDDEAVEAALNKLDGRPGELWLGAIMIGRFNDPDFLNN
jgi:hypothetical protein